jgi:GGDEF domain-containing protein
MQPAAPALMSTAELILWSACVGAAALVVLLALADYAYTRTRASLQSLVYLTGSFLFFALLSGLLGVAASALWSVPAAAIRIAQILIGPLCAVMGSWWISQWLSAHKRDRFGKNVLQAVTLTSLVGGGLCLFLKPDWSLLASAGLTMVNVSVALLISVRAAQSGDKLAWGLALGCALALPTQIGLYTLALGSSRLSLVMQSGVALVGLLSMVITARMLWLRNHHAQQIAGDDSSQRDPITRLYSSVALVRKIIAAQQRRQRTRRDGALMAVVLFEPERLLNQVGQFGMNDIYIQLARRMQRHTGVVNPAGRYYDRCFVVLIESLQSPRWIRTLGLRVASGLRQPLDVTSLAGERIKITADVAVGVVHLSSRGEDVDQLLHEVQRVAVAARGMRSRAALLEQDTGLAVPVESADLNRSWRAMRAAQPAKSRKRTAGSTSSAEGVSIRSNFQQLDESRPARLS